MDKNEDLQKRPTYMNAVRRRTRLCHGVSSQLTHRPVLYQYRPPPRTPPSFIERAPLPDKRSEATAE